MSSEYHRLFLLGIICILLASVNSCYYYPYTMAKARKDRRQKRIEQRELKKLSTIVSTDSSADAALDQVPKLEQKVPPIQKADSVLIQKGQDLLLQRKNANETEFPDTNVIPKESLDSTINLSDSLKNRIQDSLLFENTPAVETTKKDSILLNPDSLAGPLQYDAQDSMIYDLQKKKIKLYGMAVVIYENYELKANYIEIDFEKFIATAKGMPDSSGRMQGEPFFNDGNQQFEARKIQYNFKTKKGKVYDAITKQGDGYFLAKSTKFISKEGDSTASNDIVYAGGCTYTTCDHKTPHFGIRSLRAKVIPNKLIVIGPSYLEIMGTPTPLVLPFGFFPITKTRKSGLLLSTNIDNSSSLGIGLKGVGYYFAINDQLDLALTADLYSRGTFRIYAKSRYYQRYKFRGNINLSYARTKIDERGTPNFSLSQDFNLSWNHQQDPKAHPSQSFRASVNFGTSDFYRNTDPSANATLQSTLQSNISYSKRFLGTPFSLNAGAAHSQATSSHLMTITLPSVTLTMNQIFPFKRKQQIGKQRWYEKIGFSYTANASNRVQIVDTLLFVQDAWQEALDQATYYITHSPTINMNFKLPKLKFKNGRTFDLSYINFTPRISYKEHWYFYADEFEFDPTLIIKNDTIFGADEATIEQVNTDTTFGKVNEIRNYGFHTVRDFNASVSLGTQLFATGTYNLLGLHKLRAIIRPSVGFRWRPDYGNDFWGYYGRVQEDSRYPNELRQYKRFEIVPGSGQQALLTFNTNVRLEGKVKRLRIDSTITSKYRKVAFLNNLNLSGNYNMAADSLKMSVVNMNANTVLFKLITATVSFTFDPYLANPETNARIDQWEWITNRRLARLTSGAIALSTNLTSSKIRKLFQSKEIDQQPTKKQQLQNQEFQFFQNLSINYNYRFARRYVNGVDSLQSTANELALNGAVNLSKNWAIQIRRIGYDFDDKRITYPDFAFTRRLHCWEMQLSWQPERRTWNFSIHVRPGSLGFIKIPVQKTQFDPY